MGVNKLIEDHGVKNDKIEEGRGKIAFIVKLGAESFLDTFITELSKEYEIIKISIKTNEDFKLIDKWMYWADICWFEWCDELIIYGSKLEIAKKRKIVCRLHSYEAFSRYPFQVNWNNVDMIIFVAENIQKYVTERYRIDKDKTTIIPNGVDIDTWTFKERNHGFNVAYVGYVNYKKGPMLLLHTFKAIYDRDNRYKFYIAGRYQDNRYALYYQQMVKEFGLENNIFFQGWQDDLDNWLEDKNYILCTSVLESQNMSVMQAMAKGIKPIIHNFVGADGIYPRKYLWNTIDEAVGMITEAGYESSEYEQFVQDNYSLQKQLETINSMIQKLITEDKKIREFSYKDYWNQRLNSKFNIEGVGYIGLGEIYNRFLYKGRIDMLEGVIDKVFDDIRDKKVLELGPGIGIFTEYFYKKGVKEYSGIDIAEKSVAELSSKYKNYHFRQGDVSDSNNYEGKFHLIFAADVLLHITSEDNYKRAIMNISEHLEDHGICLLIDPITVINIKSRSQHVIIRNKEYINELMENNMLELIEMLPVTFFMNNPFDKDAIGPKGNLILQAFNMASSAFSNSSISNDQKELMGEYLLYRDKQLLYQHNLGLSEKLLIIRKKGEGQNINFSLKNILDMNNIRDCMVKINENLKSSNVIELDIFNKIKEILNCLEEGIINDTIS